jgi:hypothetical protein
MPAGAVEQTSFANQRDILPTKCLAAQLQRALSPIGVKWQIGGSMVVDGNNILAAVIIFIANRNLTSSICFLQVAL